MPIAFRLGVVLGLAVLAYLPFLAIPLISDDYLQIYLGRLYGGLTGWADLSADVLYRSRATSLVLTRGVDGLFGADPTAHRLLNVLLHAVCVVIVAALGGWHRIGWRVSWPAAFFFAIHEGHQEAVVWSAALPELLVFLFGTSSLIFFARRQDLPAFACFLLALLSKESAVAVVPLALAVWWFDRRAERPALLWLAAASLLSLVYALGIFAAGSSHLHLTDGTFRWNAPVWKVLPISLFRLLWIWGFVALALLAWLRAGGRTIVIALAWIIVTLLPYSFLSYMDRVPSRHTYWASAGLALLVGAAFAVCRERWHAPRLRWAVPVLVALVTVHNLAYLWTKKIDQYQRRAILTERFLREATRHNHPIRITCAAYGPDVYRYAAHIRLGSPLARIVTTENPRDAVDYCDPEQP